MIGLVDYGVVAGYLVAVLFLGLWSGRRNQSLEDYAVAGRRFSALVVFATMSASFIGGGFSLGVAERVFVFGIASVIGLWGFSLKEVLVATFVAPKLDNFPGALSAGDIMDVCYGKSGRLVTGVFGMLLCTAIVGAQVGAIGYLSNLLLGIPQIWGIAIGCGIVIAYTTVSGMNGVVISDLFQFAVLSVGIPLTLIFGVAYVGGTDELLAAVPPESLSVPGPEFTWWTVLALMLVFALGETLVPPYIQRLCIAPDARRAARGTLWAGLYSIPFFAIAGSIGLVALVVNPDIDGNLALPQIAVTVLPPVLKGLVIAAVLAIVMSSADSFLNSASIAFVNDIVRPLRSTPLDDGAALSLARVATLVLGIASVTFALTIDGILDILIHAYNYWAPVIVVPLVAGILGWRKGSAAFLAAAGAGVITTMFWNQVLGMPGSIEGMLPGVLANLLVFSVFPSVERKT